MERSVRVVFSFPGGRWIVLALACSGWVITSHGLKGREGCLSLPGPLLTMAGRNGGRLAPPLLRLSFSIVKKRVLVFYSLLCMMNPAREAPANAASHGKGVGIVLDSVLPDELSP